MKASNVALAMGAGWLVSLVADAGFGLAYGLVVAGGLLLAGLYSERQIRRDRAEHEAFLRAPDAKRVTPWTPGRN